jgi:hypothetical protein
MKARQAERDGVRSVAGMIRRAHDFWRRAAKAADGSRQEQAALTSAANYCHFVGLHICNSGSPRFLLLLADELKGKPIEIYRAGWYDDIIEAAMEAVAVRRVNGRLDINLDWKFKDFMKAFEREWEKRGKAEDKMPSYSALHRAVTRKRGKSK